MKNTVFKTFLLTSVFISFVFVSVAQEKPLKLRPDAFPPKPESTDSKVVAMAGSVEEMSEWNRYPTYETYLAMMQSWAERFPEHCRVDTIGTSVQGRLILCMHIEGERDVDLYRPQFFYSSTMHGDEVTGFVMMLRLIDTLLNGYGNNQQYTDLINSVDIYINPLSNPDGTYRGGNSTVRNAIRYNANYVDLNRNYPDPFGTEPMNPQQQENTAMINYVGKHHFRLSANLHGGAEVMNYPWDSYSSYENPHPYSEWWIEVCKRFVDTSRTYSSSHFRDTYNSGYTAGGDWYVIPNGRQDYMNYYHNCREMTMEISSDKMLSSDKLPEYWRFLQHSLVNYIAEIHTIDNSTEGIVEAGSQIAVYPNPTSDMVFIGEEPANPVTVYDMQGRVVIKMPAGVRIVDFKTLPKGVYILRTGAHSAKIIRR